MKKLLVILGCTLLIVTVISVLALSAGQDNPTISQPINLQVLEQNNGQAIANFDSYKVNEALRRLAVVFAKLVNEEPSMKDLIGQEVGKMFDDDYDSLFEIIADTEYKGVTLRKLLHSVGKENGEDDIASLLAVIPYLNLAIPVHFDQWTNYTGPIYVVPLRYDVDDMDITEYVGYGPNGQTKVFSTAVPPDFPVLVIGINERIEYLRYKESKKTQTNSTLAVNSLVTVESSTTGTYSHNEVLSSVYLMESTDSWLRGNPELYILVVYGNNLFKEKIFLEAINDLNTWVTLDQSLFQYTNVPENMYYYIELRDKDYDTYTDYKVSKTFYYDGQDRVIENTFTTSYQINASDDSFGWKLMTFFHLNPFDCYLDGNQKAIIKVSY